MKRPTQWFNNLPWAPKALITVGVLVLIGAGAVYGHHATSASVNVTPASHKSTASKKTDNSKKAAHVPVITTKTITETQPIPYTSSTVESDTQAKETSQVTTVGVNGVRTITYELTFTDGQQTVKKQLKSEVTTPPVNEVITVGTKPIYAPPIPPSM